MGELRECPFCGGEPEFVEHDPETSGTWCRYVVRCPHCEGFHGDSPSEYGVDLAFCGNDLNAIASAWNTRAERTCQKVPGKMRFGERKPKCSECGYGLGDPRWSYCPNCGARVVSR